MPKEAVIDEKSETDKSTSDFKTDSGMASEHPGEFEKDWLRTDGAIGHQVPGKM